ncbi:MAG: hypothetical protein OHK0046_36700 [Anaerolineae bacterium]
MPDTERAELLEALNIALSDGPSAISQQISYLLVLSKRNDADAMPTLYPDNPAALAEARLSLQIKLAHLLDSPRRQALYREIDALENTAARVHLTLGLLQVAPQDYTEDVRKLWEQAEKLTDPLLRSQAIFQFVPLLTRLGTGAYEESVTSYLKDAVTLAQGIQNTGARARSLIALAEHLPHDERLEVLTQVLGFVKSDRSDTLRANTVNTLSANMPQAIEEEVLACAEDITTPSERARALTSVVAVISPLLKPRALRRALEAINEIPREDDRANALIFLTPYIGHQEDDGVMPEHLQQAMHIAISLQKREARARVMVALSAHMRGEVQAEALAAVHNLSSERDRAQLLAELAPTLPPDMLVASLLVAHTMHEQDSRVHVLTVLARYMPRHQRQQTLLDAMAAASNLPHQYERVRSLMGLMEVLPANLKEQASLNALETTQLIENENARARAFSLLAGHLPPDMLLKAMAAAAQIKDPEQRLNAMISLLPHIPEDKRLDVLPRLLESVQQMSMNYKRARAIITIAPHLVPPFTDRAVGIADVLDDPVDQVSAYTALAPVLAADMRATIIGKTWKLIKQIDEGYDRSTALFGISALLPPSAYDDLAKEATEVIRSIEDDYDRASTISILAPLLAKGKKKQVPLSTLFDKFIAIRDGLMAALEVPQQAMQVQQVAMGAALWVTLPPEQRYKLWQQFVRKLYDVSLPELLMILGALLPVIRSLVEDETVLKEIAQMIEAR